MKKVYMVTLESETPVMPSAHAVGVALMDSNMVHLMGDRTNVSVQEAAAEYGMVSRGFPEILPIGSARPNPQAGHNYVRSVGQWRKVKADEWFDLRNPKEEANG